jgi:hypothetical protein
MFAGRWLHHVAVHGDRRNGDKWRFLHRAELQLPEVDIDQLRGCASVVDVKHFIVEHLEHLEHIDIKYVKYVKYIDIEYLDHIDNGSRPHDDNSGSDNKVLHL